MEGWVVGTSNGGFWSCCGGAGVAVVVVDSADLDTPLKIPRDRDSFLASREEDGANSSPSTANARIRNSSSPRWTYFIRILEAFTRTSQ